MPFLLPKGNNYTIGSLLSVLPSSAERDCFVLCCYRCPEDLTSAFTLCIHPSGGVVCMKHRLRGGIHAAPETNRPLDAQVVKFRAMSLFGVWNHRCFSFETSIVT